MLNAKSGILKIGEKRELAIDEQRVDAKHLVDGKLPVIEAELVSTDRARKVRNYHVGYLDLNIKPYADCPDDIARIEAIVQSHLDPELKAE